MTSAVLSSPTWARLDKDMLTGLFGFRARRSLAKPSAKSLRPPRSAASVKVQSMISRWAWLPPKRFAMKRAGCRQRQRSAFRRKPPEGGQRCNNNCIWSIRLSSCPWCRMYSRMTFSSDPLSTRSSLAPRNADLLSSSSCLRTSGQCGSHFYP